MSPVDHHTKSPRAPELVEADAVADRGLGDLGQHGGAVLGVDVVPADERGDADEHGAED